MYKTVLLDLDGTITDSAPGIVNSVNYALEKFGIKEHDVKKLKTFIGPPLKNSFMQKYGFSEEEAVKGIQYYREYYGEKGIYENSLYDGIEETLGELNRIGLNVVMATSKPEFYLETILDHFNIRKYFSFTAGSNMDGTRTEKSEVIAYALDKCNIDKKYALMIGDRENDVRGALLNGIDILAVLYGFGSYEELKNAGAQKFAETTADIIRFI